MAQKEVATRGVQLASRTPISEMTRPRDLEISKIFNLKSSIFNLMSFLLSYRLFKLIELCQTGCDDSMDIVRLQYVVLL